MLYHSIHPEELWPYNFENTVAHAFSDIDIHERMHALCNGTCM